MFQLRVESGDRSGEVIPLPPPAAGLALGIGRGLDAALRFSDSTMSRHQADLRCGEEGWSLENHSRHGSYVGRKLLQAGETRRLRHGDVLLLGETRVVFEEVALPATPGVDPLTPATPTIAAPPSMAGYDPDGYFHSGQTLLTVAGDPQSSFVMLPGGIGGATIKVKRRRLYFFALVGLLGLLGCVATGLLIVLPTLVRNPRDMVLATLFAFLPALPYALLIKFLDRNDQIPWKNFVACAVWGATVGCGFSLVLNSFGSGVLASLVGPADAWSLTAILWAPLVEEVVKGLAILVLFWILHDEFDNVLEGLVLGAASGLGFALVENCIYNVRFLSAPEGGGLAMVVMGTYRMVVNALIGHPVYTAMTGAGLGLLRETPRHRGYRLLFPALGLFTAIGMHVTWNAAAVYVGKVLGDQSGLLTLTLNAALFGGAGLLFFIAAYVFAAARERRVLVAYLSEEVGKGFVEQAELQSFHRLLGRLRYELEGLLRGGLRVYWNRKALRRAQVELAFRKWHLAQGDAVRGGGRYDQYIRDARLRIRDARNRLTALEREKALPLAARTPGPMLAPPPAAASHLPPSEDTPSPEGAPSLEPPAPPDAPQDALGIPTPRAE